MQGCLNIWEASKHMGGVQTYMGHPNIWEVSKHAGGNQTYGVFKHTGGIQTYGVSNIWGNPDIQGVSKHMGHPNMGDIQTCGASKHTGDIPQSRSCQKYFVIVPLVILPNCNCISERGCNHLGENIYVLNMFYLIFILHFIQYS